MALIVNTDTYITLDEANTYITNYYVSTDPLRVQWLAMSTNDREALLRKAFVQINSLPFTGKPKNPKQPLPFPRNEMFTAQDFLKVKYAQAEQAMAISDLVTAQEVEDRIKLRRAGVVQYTIGDLTEKFQSGLPAESNATFFGLGIKSYNYLKKWLQGGYKVCTSTKKPCGHPLWWLP